MVDEQQPQVIGFTNKIVWKNIDSLKTDPQNPNVMTTREMNALRRSMKKFNYIVPIVIDQNDMIADGEHRRAVAKEYGMQEVPCVVVEMKDDSDRRLLRQTLNQLRGQNDPIKYADELAVILAAGKLDELEYLIAEDVSEFKKILSRHKGFDLGLGGPGSLAKRFGVPPFSVLDVTTSTWQNRKREWLNWGIVSEEGRTHVSYWNTNLIPSLPSVSLFDPVLAEISYRWFTPKQRSRILDPFSGGSVRGIVASFLGHEYHGIDIRKEQTDANVKQWERLKARMPDNSPAPTWYAGDSFRLEETLPQIERDNKFDMLLTSPPYYGQEKYSDDKDDLSNLDYEQFMARYLVIIEKCASVMKEGSFIVWNTSNSRKPEDGEIASITSAMTRKLKSCGFMLASELVLVRAVASLPMMINRQFTKHRTVGSRHEMVMVYFKGNHRDAIPALDERVVDIPAIEERDVDAAVLEEMKKER